MAPPSTSAPAPSGSASTPTESLYIEYLKNMLLAKSLARSNNKKICTSPLEFMALSSMGTKDSKFNPMSALALSSIVNNPTLSALSLGSTASDLMFPFGLGLGLDAGGYVFDDDEKPKRRTCRKRRSSSRKGSRRRRRN